MLEVLFVLKIFTRTVHLQLALKGEGTAFSGWPPSTRAFSSVGLSNRVKKEAAWEAPPPTPYLTAVFMGPQLR